MTRTPQTEQRKADDTDLKIKLDFFPTDPFPPAGGGFNNTAEAKLTNGSGGLMKNYYIQFQINDGDATFQDAVGDGKTITVQTGINGRADALFGDPTQETKTMTATAVKYPDGTNIDIKDRPSDTESFTFSAAPVTYEIAALTSLTPNGVVVDDYNEGEAVITKNGGHALDPGETVIVTFGLNDSSYASFDPNKPNVVGNPDPQTLWVQTSKNSNGQDVADAYFSDWYAEGVGLTVSLKDYPDVPRKDQGFTFLPAHTIDLFPAFDYATAGDPSSQNCVLAAVMGSDGKVDTGYTGSVIFTVDKSATMVNPDRGLEKQSTVPVTKGFAEAYFVDEDPDAPTTISAVLADNTAPQAFQAFHFCASGTWFDSQLDWQSTYVPSSFKGIGAYYQFNAIINPGPTDLYFCLPAASSAKFLFPQDQGYVYVNDKVYKVPGASIAPKYLLINFYGLTEGEKTTITVTAPGLCPSAALPTVFSAPPPADH